MEHHFDYIDSGASDRVIDWIVLGKIPEDIQADLDRVRRENEHRRTLDFLPEGYWRDEKHKKAVKEEEA